MYKCLDCGYVFKTPKQYKECHDDRTGLSEKYYGCPRCAGAYDLDKK